MAKKLSSQSSGLRQEVQTTTSAFAQTVCEARKRAGQSQLQLARIAGVSPKTVAKIEETGIARFDAIVRLAKALGQPVNDWLVEAGHHVPRSKVEDILADNRADQLNSPFPQLTPETYMKRTDTRLQDSGVALRCLCLMSPLALSTPAVLERVTKVMEDGLHVAMVSPFPISGERIKKQFPALAQYYATVYNWAYDAARNMRKQLPAAKNRIHVFVPRVRDEQSVIPVCPPTRVSEIRPVLTQYGYQDPNNPNPQKTLFEFGVYNHHLDHRPDYWVDVYSGEENLNQRGVETFNVWYDYLRDILEGWKPIGTGSASEADYTILIDDSSAFWQLMEV